MPIKAVLALACGTNREAVWTFSISTEEVARRHKMSGTRRFLLPLSGAHEYSAGRSAGQMKVSVRARGVISGVD